MDFFTKLKIFFGGGKGKFLKLRINYPDKTTQVFYIKRNGTDAVSLDDGYYYVKTEDIHDEEGFKTLTYNYEDPQPIDYLDFKREVSQLTAQKIKAGMEERISRHIIDSVRDENKVDNSLKLVMGLLFIGVVALGFFMYDQMTTMMEMLSEQQKVIDQLRQIITQGGLE